MTEMQTERDDVEEESSALGSLHGEQTLPSEAYRVHLFSVVSADNVTNRRWDYIISTEWQFERPMQYLF
jgi:hypothetical protein